MTSAANPSTGACILLVEDNEDAAALLCEYLQAIGYVVEVAHDAQAALETLAGFAPAVGILDLGLPVTDGYELAKMILAKHPDLRLIALSGSDALRDRQRSTAAGFSAHLAKPVDVKALRKLLTEYTSR